MRISFKIFLLYNLYIILVIIYDFNLENKNPIDNPNYFNFTEHVEFLNYPIE
jgi:hypothetical protein